MADFVYNLFLQWPAEIMAGLVLLVMSIFMLAAPIYAGMFVYAQVLARWPRWLALVLALAGGLYVALLMGLGKDALAVALLHIGRGDDF
jgi:hypothetical protein